MQLAQSKRYFVDKGNTMCHASAVVQILGSLDSESQISIQRREGRRSSAGDCDCELLESLTKRVLHAFGKDWYDG